MSRPALNLIFNKRVVAKEDKDKDDPRKSIFSPKTSNVLIRKPKFNHFIRDLDFEPLDIMKIHLYFIAEEEVNRLKVVDVKNDKKDFTKKEYISIENSNTVSDNRMFPQILPICSTCELTRNYCPGHLGRISLKYPVINAWAYTYVVSVLESICHTCSKLLISPDIAKKYRYYDRLKKISLTSKGLKCRNRLCPDYDKPNPTFEKAVSSFVKINYDKIPGGISSTKILIIFNRIREEDLEALGYKQNSIYYNHPKNMLMTSLPVIPENHRPNTFTNKIQPNILTMTYNKIVTTNNNIVNGISVDNFNSEVLADEVSSIYQRNTDSSGKSDYHVETNKNVKELIMKKTGLIKSNAQAKRCNRTARTVLGPGGDDILFGYIGLPSLMTKIQVKEGICEKNIDYYNNLVKSGVNIQAFNGDRTFYVSNNYNNVLTLGTTIYRPLMNGDPIIFNRNPTLHKHSMQGYIAKIKQGLTIGLHSSVTTPHNADFDGDEGNINICPGYKARAEILHISGCWNNVIGSQFSRPMMGLVFNAITSAYLMSRYGPVNENFWDKIMKTVFHRSVRISSLESRAKRRRPNDTNWKNGPVLFSSLLPENFYYNNNGVIIEEGILVKGDIKKGHIGPSTGSIVHMIHHYYGNMIVTQFISEGQLLLDAFISFIGFTVGYKDCSMPNEEIEVKNIVDKEIKRVQTKLKEIESLSNDKYEEIRSYYNQTVQAELNSVTTIGKEIIEKALPDTNGLKIMAICGSKGKEADIAQVIGIVGQQFIEGKRPRRVFNNNLRFLPAYDIKAEGRDEKITDMGFVDRALGKGMRPGQFFAHMMASRIGLIDTALGTATTGYSHRKIIKALEDLRYSYNGTICGDLGQVIQYVGGYDSYEPSSMIEVNCPGFGKIWSPIDIEGLAQMLNAED